MRKGSIKSHIFGVFAALGALIAAAALGGLWGRAGIFTRARQIETLGESRHRGEVFLKDALDLQLSLAEYLRTGDDFNAQGYVKTLAILRAGLADAAKGDGRDLQVDRLKEAASLLDKWDADVAQPLLAAKKRLVDLKAGSLPEVSRGEKTIRDLKELLSEYITDTGEDLKAQRAQENAAFSRLNLLILGGAALALAGAAALLLNLLSTVVRPLLGIAAWAKAAREGKRFDLEISSNDEVGDLADAFSALGEQYHAARHEFAELAAMPDGNANPILQMKGASEVVYANTAAQNLCRTLNLTPLELLPGGLDALLDPVMGTDALVQKERDFGSSKYRFFFRTRPGDGPIFVVAFAAAGK